MYSNLEYQYLNNSTFAKDDYIDKAEVFNAFFTSALNMDNGLRESQSQSWRVMTENENSQLSLKMCVMCCSSWILTYLWDLRGFIQESSKSQLMPSQNLS